MGCAIEGIEKIQQQGALSGFLWTNLDSIVRCWWMSRKFLINVLFRLKLFTRSLALVLVWRFFHISDGSLYFFITGTSSVYARRTFKTLTASRVNYKSNPLTISGDFWLITSTFENNFHNEPPEIYGKRKKHPKPPVVICQDGTGGLQKASHYVTPIWAEKYLSQYTVKKSIVWHTKSRPNHGNSRLVRGTFRDRDTFTAYLYIHNSFIA